MKHSRLHRSIVLGWVACALVIVIGIAAIGTKGNGSQGLFGTMVRRPAVPVEMGPQIDGAPTVAHLKAAKHPGAPQAPIKAVAPSSRVLPTGKGMWIWLPERANGGNVHSIVDQAERMGLTHLYVRVGSSVGGFHGRDFITRLLPVAHAAGLRVYGWDFPYLSDIGKDVGRARNAIHLTTKHGHKLDGFVADVETHGEGVNLSTATATQYGHDLRAMAGPKYPLLVAVPRPSNVMTGGRYPFGAVVKDFDAVIPMVYWLGLDPAATVTMSITYLKQFGKPIIPVGQAYDSGVESGVGRMPTANDIARFVRAAKRHGATGVSLWSWQHASSEVWWAFSGAPEYTKAPKAPHLSSLQLEGLQVVLTAMGHPVPASGRWDSATVAALRGAQAELGLKVTGRLDGPTRKALKHRTRGLVDLG